MYRRCENCKHYLFKRKLKQYDCMLSQTDFRNAQECNMFDVDLNDSYTYSCNEYNCLFVNSIQLSSAHAWE